LKFYRIVRLIKTLQDVGFSRLSKRIRYEIRKKIDNSVFSKTINNKIFNYKNREIKFCFCDAQFIQKEIYKNEFQDYKSVEFCFLNQNQTMLFPIDWNPPFQRLWVFNLHYFDWAREWIEEAYFAKNWQGKNLLIDKLIDDWINNNPVGFGDGWHSYTLSLRIRNWIWIFKFFPEFINNKRIESLWMQLLWLDVHPEDCHGGNHWLENLITLSIGALHFSHSKAEKIYEVSMKKLEIELSLQILNDGGHEERSASYHILLLDRLVDLSLLIEKKYSFCPLFLKKAILNMANWAIKIRLKNGQFPRFNDSSKDICPPIDVVIYYAKKFLDKNYYDIEFSEKNIGIRSFLLKGRRDILQVSKNLTLQKQTNFFTCLHETGWFFIRPNKDWEFIFKCGIPCPKHLAAHAHSDQLTFELIYRGKAIISEAGVSCYTKSEQRKYERSGQAHNIFQIVDHRRGLDKWLEAIDVWDVFRAGEKSYPIKRNFGFNNKGKPFIEGGNSIYSENGIDYLRRIDLDFQENTIFLKINDSITIKKGNKFRIWIHFSPIVNSKIFEKIRVKTNIKKILITKLRTSYAESFGVLKKRNSCCIEGQIPKGFSNIETSIEIDPTSDSFI